MGIRARYYIPSRVRDFWIVGNWEGNFWLARDPPIDESLVQSRADRLVHRRNPFYFLQC